MIEATDTVEAVQMELWKKYKHCQHVVTMIEEMTTKDLEWVIEQLERLIGDDIPRES